ncbi:MAG: hypothetical protein IPG44_10075 [Anaerolineales bacterium]|nr:hypothetical protein [Anaerolineales bacterium]
MVVSSSNDFVTNLVKERLGEIYTGEFKTWDQVDASFPAEAITHLLPGADSPAHSTTSLKLWFAPHTPTPKGS